MAVSPSAVRLQRCVVSPAGKHSASLIFLHGSGFSQLLWESFKYKPGSQNERSFSEGPSAGKSGGMYLSASVSCCLTHAGEAIGYAALPHVVSEEKCKEAEHLESIDGMRQVLTELIDDEVKSGIQKSRILIGGFSMGGCMAMHLAYRNHRDVAGVFALSSFLNKDSAIYKDLLQADGAFPELFQCHGTADELVLHSWGEETNSKLKSLGVSAVFHSLPNLYHDLNRTELERLKSWILTKLPGETDGQNK
ncbi:Lysophospholipase-like protein 1 [Microtus ochrogaster]|uniref:palmitoyl-protein hydrolase n=1 Tax=Microtus ochrogaster TaxID=79684 RepID=A0A8J6KSX5_MICOH|nr:Lysophospholipase-like protein 1 [Microtus ochrogaster]